MTLIHWEALALRENWRDYVLPQRTNEQFEDEGRQQAAELLPLIAPQHTVIDYGCGTGRVARYLVDHCARLIGLDAAGGFVRRAREAVPEAEFWPVGCFKKQGIADFCYAVMVYQHNTREDREQITNHVLELLKPGGVLWASFPIGGRGSYRVQRQEGPGFMMRTFEVDEVREIGERFAHHQITEGQLVAYSGQPVTSPQEYILMAVKE